MHADARTSRRRCPALMPTPSSPPAPFPSGLYSGTSSVKRHRWARPTGAMFAGYRVSPTHPPAARAGRGSHDHRIRLDWLEVAQASCLCRLCSASWKHAPPS